MYTSQKGGDTVGNLFTHEQHSFYSKEKDVISYFGPRKEEEEKEKRQQFISGSGDLPQLGEQVQTLLKIGSRESDNSFPNATQFPPDRPVDGANDSEMTPVPSFGKISADPDEKNTISVSNISDHKAAHQGTTSSVSGSDLVNFSDHKHANESTKLKKAATTPVPDAESLAGDSVTDIMNPNTDLKQVSFEQQQEISPVVLSVPLDDHHEACFLNASQKHDSASLKKIQEFDNFDGQVIDAEAQLSKKPISKTPDASNEKTFNAQFYNQSFSADLEPQNGMNLPAFDEEPIDVDPELHESDDGEILQNIVLRSSKNQENTRNFEAGRFVKR